MHTGLFSFFSTPRLRVSVVECLFRVKTSVRSPYLPVQRKFGGSSFPPKCSVPFVANTHIVECFIFFLTFISSHNNI